MAKLVSKVYSDALFEAARDNLDVVYDEICLLQDVFLKNPNIKSILTAPKVSKREKWEMVCNMFESRVSDTTMGFLHIVMEKNRQAQLEEIFVAFIARVKEHRKIGIAYVKSAIVLNDVWKKAIKEKLLKTTAYTSFEIHYEVDESLIGGLQIRIGDRIIDSTISHHLYELKKDLMNMQLA